MITSRSQRWRDRRASFVPAASEINPRRLSVDVNDTRRQATPFDEAHYDAGSTPVCAPRSASFAMGQPARRKLPRSVLDHRR